MLTHKPPLISYVSRITFYHHAMCNPNDVTVLRHLRSRVTPPKIKKPPKNAVCYGVTPVTPIFPPAGGGRKFLLSSHQRLSRSWLVHQLWIAQSDWPRHSR